MKTVLLTGITGFIAKHIAVELLNAGYTVRGSMRSTKRVQEVNASVAKGLKDPSLLTRLSFCELDLTKDTGWTDAMRGMDALLHTASPFPLVQPKNEQDLIAPAVDGTMRALNAAKAAECQRVILTSSTVAIAGSPLQDGQTAYSEQNWTDVNAPGTSAYAKSKTLAEKAAWDFVENEAPEIALTTINPGLVLGAPLDVHYSTSLAVVERLLRGKDPMVPRLAFSSVHVKDIAALHLAALKNDETSGQRIMGVDQELWFEDIAKAIKEAHPNRKIPTRVAPDILIKFLGLFDPAIKGIVPQLGRRQPTDNSRAKALLGREFMDARAAAVEGAEFILAEGLS